MKYRDLGNTGMRVSEISLGTWQLGGKWGADYSEQTAQTTLETAYDHGINFFDTADVYNDGKSERSIGQFIQANAGGKSLRMFQQAIPARQLCAIQRRA